MHPHLLGDRVRENPCCLRVLLQFANLHRFAVVHLDAPPWCIRDVQPALLLQTQSPSLLQIGHQFESTREILARILRWRVGPKYLRLTGSVLCNQDSVRILPAVLAATSRAPPVALLPLVLAVTVP